MILHSLSSPSVKRCLLLVAGFLGLAAASCFAQPIFFPVESTPYDNQMARVQPILASITLQPADEISLTVVNQWMTQLRRLPYRYSKQWQTPFEVTEARRADCKGKAITLYELMQAIGASNVRFVIGKRRAGDWFTHAWLEWETVDGNYLLDPTFNRVVTRAERLSSKKYIPLYAYEGAFKFRAFNETLFAEMPHAVAAGRRN